MTRGRKSTTLGELGDWRSGITPRATNPDFYGGGIAFVTIGDLDDGLILSTSRTLTESGLAEIGRLAPANSVFVSMYGTIGKVGISDRPMATNQAITWLECNHSIATPKFVFYFLLGHAKALDARGRGATQRNINRQMVKETPVVLPPLSEQRRIVDLIEAVDTFIEAAMRKTEAARNARRALLDDLLSAGGESWQDTTLGEVGVEKGLIGGPFGSSLVRKDYVDTGVPVIRGANLPNSSRYVTGEFVFVSEEKGRSLSRNQALPGDIVATQRGTLGQVAIVPEGQYQSYVISQSQMRLRVDPGQADRDFVYLWIDSEAIRAEIQTRKIATANPHINLGIFSSLPIRLPPLAEQRRIVGIVEAATTAVDAAAEVQAAARRLKAGLIFDLLSGKHEIPETYDNVLESVT